MRPPTPVHAGVQRVGWQGGRVAPSSPARRCTMRRIGIILGLLILASCSKPPTTGSVDGTITYKGKAVNAAAIVLHSTGKADEQFVVPVTQEGTFSTSSVPLGEYKIVVEVNKGGSGPSTAGMSA